MMCFGHELQGGDPGEMLGVPQGAPGCPGGSAHGGDLVISA